MIGSWTRETAEAAALGAAPVIVAALLVAGAWPQPEAPVRPEAFAEDAAWGDEEERQVEITDRAAARGETLTQLEAEIVELAALGDPASPFGVDDAAGDVDGEPIEREREPETPEFALTSVMGGGAGAVCVINERVRRAGDEAAPGWVVRSIDVAGRSVTLAGPGGESVTLTQRR
jgi:hypothetical protein